MYRRFVGLRGFTWGAAALVAVTLSACGLDSEPSRVCGSLDLTATQTRAHEPVAPTVIALSTGTNEITVVRACQQLGACEAELVTQTISLGERGVPDQLLLTASGRWLTYRIDTQVYSLDLESDDLYTRGGPVAHDLIGSLRGGDWLIYRTWGDSHTASKGSTPPIHESELWAYYVPGVVPGVEADEQPNRHFRIGESLGSTIDLRVAAMGHRHIVARRLLGNGEEELYLVRIAPARRYDELGESNRGKPLLLARGKPFTRVLITTGPSPAERGDPSEFQHEVPTDVQVIATSGTGSSARTLIYAVSNTEQVANFEGAVVSSPLPLETITGLNPVSPSGSHLAYITPRGSLALRSLTPAEDDYDDRACMIRPATAAKHMLAGFAADGTLYFESSERRASSTATARRGVDLIYAYDPAAQEFTRLTNETNSWRLYAVPPRRFEAEDGVVRPWAVVAYDGFHGARPDASPSQLQFDHVNFLPRGDDTLWLLEGQQSNSFTIPNRLTLRRVQPKSSSDVLTFDVKTADPSVLDRGELHERFTRTYLRTASVCVSASQSASQTTPWATSCSTPDKPTDYLNAGFPAREY